MNNFAFVVAICYLTVAQSSYQSHHDIQLQSVPDVSSYQKTVYPKPALHDLGEHYEAQNEPEIIKIVKTLKLEIPRPYPVHVPHKVPYPVAVKVPQIIKVPHVVKVSHAVPVEVVKHVPVPQQSSHEEGSQGDGGSYGGTYGGSYSGNYGIQPSYGQAQGLGSYGASGYGGQDSYAPQQSSGYGGGADHASIQAAYGAPSASYGAPSASYGVPAASYGGDNSGSFVPSSYQAQSQGGEGHSSEESNSVNAYQSYDAQNQYSGGEQGGSAEQGDHTAQASSASGIMQAQEQGGSYMVEAGYQVKDNNQGAMNNQK